MINRIVTSLVCSVAPFALMAQQVDLRSPDEFISVEGEIVGYNGVMLRVETSVGLVSVPASEVICYGVGCEQIIASNNFGLTADALIDVIAQRADAPPDDAPDANASGTLSVGFDSPAVGSLFRTVAGAYAVASDTGVVVELSATGSVSLSNPDGDQTLTLSPADAGAGDINIGTVSLNGTADARYNVPDVWISTAQPSHQLIGLKSFSVVAAPNAGISEISLSDLARVFSGEVTNWSQIGGADINVLPLQLPTNSPVWDEIDRLVMQPFGKTVAGNVLTMADQAGISGSILQFPGSVSIISSEGANEDLTIGVSGACGIAVTPTEFNIISGDYPLSRAVMATYGAGANAGLVTELLDFASNDVTQGLLVNEGFLDHSAQVQDPTVKNARLGELLNLPLDDVQRNAAAQMFQALFDANRLSTTVTGGAASGPEGAWNRAMMIDLVNLLSSPENQGREVVFVGFGSSPAGSTAAIEASAAAAEDMQVIFERFAGDTIAANGLTTATYGFGDVSPATCVDGQVAGSDYTRIEVWLR